MSNKPASLTDGFRNRRNASNRKVGNPPVKDNRVYNRDSYHANTYNGLSPAPAPDGQYLRPTSDQYFEQQLRIEDLQRKLRKKNQENLELQRRNEELVVKLQSALLRNLDSDDKHKQRNTFSKVASAMNIKLMYRIPRDTLRRSKIIQSEACFNNDLDKVIKHEHHPIPKVLVECITILERKPEYMEAPGLYRVSGNHTIIQNLRFDINANVYTNLRKQTDPHNLTGIVKLFLRELNQPLISLQQLEIALPNIEFFDMEHAHQLNAIKTLYRSLPTINRDTLKYLIPHLREVSKRHNNQMNANSLSIVIGACIFYETMQDLNIPDNVNRCILPNKCIEMMIQYYNEIFLYN